MPRRFPRDVDPDAVKDHLIGQCRWLTASLRNEWSLWLDGGLDKQEAPQPDRQGTSTDRVPVRRSHGGRYAECA